MGGKPDGDRCLHFLLLDAAEGWMRERRGRPPHETGPELFRHVLTMLADLIVQVEDERNRAWVIDRIREELPGVVAARRERARAAGALAAAGQVH